MSLGPIPPGSEFECVALTGLVLELHIGIREWEREPGRRQRVQVDVECYRSPGKRPGSIEDCIDYSRLYRYLTTDWPARPHTDLLETLAYDMVDFTMADAKVEAVWISLTKLDVYPATTNASFRISKRR